MRSDQFGTRYCPLGMEELPLRFRCQIHGGGRTHCTRVGPRIAGKPPFPVRSCRVTHCALQRLQAVEMAASVMDIDDIPSTYIRTELENAGGASRRSRTRIRWQARSAVRGCWDRFTAISVCSEADRGYLGLGQNVHVIPNGFEKPERLPPRRVAQPPRFGFIGTMEFKADAAGMRWFAAQCWPRVKKLLPDARFRLIGTGDQDFSTTLGTDMMAWGTWTTLRKKSPHGRPWWCLYSWEPYTSEIAEAFSRRCPIVSAFWVLTATTWSTT